MEVEEATATAATTTAAAAVAAATVIEAASLECSRGATRSAPEHSPDVTAADTGGSSDASLLPSGAKVAAVGRAGVVSPSAVAVAVGSIMHGCVPFNESTESTAAAVGVSAAVSDASMTPADTGGITGATGTAPVPVVDVGAAGRGRGRVGRGEGRGLRPALMRVFIAFKSFVLAHSAHTHTHTHTHKQKDINLKSALVTKCIKAKKMRWGEVRWGHVKWEEENSIVMEGWRTEGTEGWRDKIMEGRGYEGMKGRLEGV
jgi:hypothetical protein